jgi:hypothetical protein
MMQIQNLINFKTICQLDLANSFGPDGEASYGQIAAYGGIDETVLKRILRYAMTLRMFCEPRKDVVAHTARSILFRKQQIKDFMENGLEEMIPAALKVGDA